jgi:hypothetical protein
LFEHPIEVENLDVVRTTLLYERENFVRFIFNGSWNSVTHRESINHKLLDYEQTVAIAADEGLNLEDKSPVYQWDYIQSVFFTSTILTTIGKLGIVRWYARGVHTVCHTGLLIFICMVD